MNATLALADLQIAVAVGALPADAERVVRALVARGYSQLVAVRIAFTPPFVRPVRQGADQ